MILYTCEVSPCLEQAQIVKSNLAAIGLRVNVKTLTSETLFAKLATPGEPFDMGWIGWEPDYLDPAGMLNELLEQGSALPTLVDSKWRARLVAASRLTGAERDANYGRLDADAPRPRRRTTRPRSGNQSGLDFFSSRMGCQVFTTAYGIDLAALCIRRTHK